MRIVLALLGITVALSACDDSELRALREQLADARERLAAAQDDARDAERARRATAEQLQQLRDVLGSAGSPGEGTVIAIPLVGRLLWRCNDAREFSFTVVPEQATIGVEHAVGGQVTRKQLHPGAELTSPFRPPSAQEWTLTYRHKPATISAGVAVLPAVKRGACFIKNVTLEQDHRPN